MRDRQGVPPAPAAEGIIAGEPATHWIYWAQWIAMATMVADHLAVYLLPDAALSPWVSASVGRIAYPVFAGIMAFHLLHHTRSLKRYIKRVFVIGVIAQVVYLAFPTYPVYAYLNICFTLALGLMVYGWAGGVRYRWRYGQVSVERATVEAMVLVPLILMASLFVEFGPVGVLLVPTLALAFRHLRPGEPRMVVAATAGGLFAVAAMLNAGALATGVTLLTTAVLILLAGHATRAPRWVVPPFVWRAWYPFHFVVLLALLTIKNGLR